MTNYSGLYDGVHGSPHALLSSSVKKGNAETALARVFGKRGYSRAKLRELIVTLTGSAVGGTASDTHKRVKWTPELEGVTGGGQVDIETHTNVNRATISDDVAHITAALQQSSQPSTYVKDAAGVGGGGKLGW